MIHKKDTISVTLWDLQHSALLRAAKRRDLTMARYIREVLCAQAARDAHFTSAEMAQLGGLPLIDARLPAQRTGASAIDAIAKSVTAAGPGAVSELIDALAAWEKTTKKKVGA